jgi:hypothetical protein
VPNVVEEQVTVTVCKPQITEEPYEYQVTVCKPEVRECTVKVCDWKQKNVVPVMAVVGVDAELPDDLEGVFAPIDDVDEGVVERGAVIAGEAAAVAERVGSGENVGGDNFIEQAFEFAIRQVNMVERFELLAEVLLQRGPVPDVCAIFVLQTLKLLNELVFKFAFGCCHCDLFVDSWPGLLCPS